MNQLSRIALIASLLLPFAAGAASAPVAANAHAARPDSYSVFVDLPTGYMFVKTPVGWKFRGQLPAERYAAMPVGTYVSLVPSAQVVEPTLASDADIAGSATGSH